MVSGKKIKLLRLNNGWSQEQLAEISALGVRTIQRIEKDGKCSLESKLSLSSAFNVSPNDLIRDAEFEMPIQQGMNWSGAIGIAVSISIVLIVSSQSGSLWYYLDIWSILLVTVLPFGLSCISSGLRNSITVYLSISWILFLPSNQKVDPSLIPCIRRIIFYTYVSGGLGAIVSLIAIFSNLTPSNSDYWPALAISMTSTFSAVLFAELILRPLKHRFEQIVYFSKISRVE